MAAFRTLDTLQPKGKRVLVRVDLNVPMENGKVTDATRIDRILPTIREIADKGGKVILLAHFGRPKNGPDEANSLKPIAAVLADHLKRPVAFAADCIGEVAEKAVAAMKDGDVLLLENTRFHKGEEKNDPAIVAGLAALGDAYVNDAFSAAHRAHASTEGVAHKLPAFAGRTMQAELEALDAALGNPKKPVAAMPRPRVWRTSCRPLPAARCRPNSRRSTPRSETRRSPSRPSSAARKCRPSSTCSAIS